MNIRHLILAATAVVALAACSQDTMDDAEVAAERAAADTAENAEVVGEKIRDGAIVASDEISEGAGNLNDRLEKDRASDTDPSDGELDGTD
ncbi:MAG: hypothetical protein WBA68_00355 [Alteraurantiacibacter sp.]